MNELIQANYDTLAQIAQRFQQTAENNAQLHTRLTQQVDQLRQAGWEGHGATAFFGKLDGEVFPAAQRLSIALEQAQSVTLHINVVMQEAEMEAVALFNNANASGYNRSGTVDILAPEAVTFDDGAGQHASKSPVAADYTFKQLLFMGATYWDRFLGRPDAAQHMRHYLRNSGDPINVDVIKMLNDMPHFRTNSDIAFDGFLNDVGQEIWSQYQGQPLQFDYASDWYGFYALPGADENQNWYYALGGFSYAYAAKVTVLPPETLNGDPTVQIDYQMHVSDAYNWDEGKSVTIDKPVNPITGNPIRLPIPDEYSEYITDMGDHWHVRDEALGRLHLVGLAQEFEVAGTTPVESLHYQLSFDDNTPVLTPETTTLPVGR
jgi:WXG100 family type VII secretion target